MSHFRSFVNPSSNNNMWIFPDISVDTGPLKKIITLPTLVLPLKNVCYDLDI